VDIFTGQGDDEDEENDDEGETGIELFVKKRWNLNASFREDKSEDALKPETFDFINSRMLADGIDRDRWPTYVKELHALLRPDGWLQMIETHPLFQSDSGREAPALQRWFEWYIEAMNRMNKDARVGARLRELMIDAGFRDVRYSVVKMPIGMWDRGKFTTRHTSMSLS
jgi:hypothetical protein